jgi:hypothetical protein
MSVFDASFEGATKQTLVPIKRNLIIETNKLKETISLLFSHLMVLSSLDVTLRKDSVERPIRGDFRFFVRIKIPPPMLVIEMPIKKISAKNFLISRIYQKKYLKKYENVHWTYHKK